MADSVFVGYNPDALQYLPDLNALFAGLDAETSAKVSQTLYAGLVTGANPRDLRSSLVDCVSPARAEMIARTEMLGAYRSAALDAYRANSDVVGSWVWISDLVGACISCLEQDGSIHDLDEDINDMSHPSCRCTAAPVTASWQDILGPLGIDASDIPETSLAGANFLTGDEWFGAQSAAVQREIMGQAAWNAWQQGDLHIVDLVGEDGSVNSLKSLGLDFRDYLDRNMIDLGEVAATSAEQWPEGVEVLQRTEDGLIELRTPLGNVWTYEDPARDELKATLEDIEELRAQQWSSIDEELAALRDASGAMPIDEAVAGTTTELTDAEKALVEAQARVDEMRAKWEADNAAARDRHLPFPVYTDDIKSALWDVARAQAAVDEEAGGSGSIVFARDYRDPFGGVDKMLAQLEQDFGRPFTRDDIAGLVGAPDGSYVEIYSSGPRQGYIINLHGPTWDPLSNLSSSEYDADRYLLPTGRGGWYMNNSGIGIREDLQGSGLGRQIFADEVKNLSDLGVKYIETSAAGGGSGEIGLVEQGTNGYYTWPRFGYTGKLPEYSRGLLREAVEKGEVPASWGKYTTIQQLMRTPEGREWWKAYGEQLELRFDLRDGSLSRRILDKYLQEKNQAASGDIFGLRGGASEPTGKPLQRLPDNRGVAAQLSDRYPNLTVDLPGLNADTANDVAQAFDAVAQRWPDAADRMQFFGLDVGPDAERLYPPDGRLPASANAGADPNGRFLLLNTGRLGDVDKMMADIRQDIEVGFHPEGSDSLGFVITHEVGHIVEAWIRTDPERAALLDAFQAEHVDDAYSLGEYASVGRNSRHEAFAHAWAANEMGILDDNPYVQAQAEFIEQLLADHPGTGDAIPFPGVGSDR